MNDTVQFFLPSKLGSYLRRLEIEYRRSGSELPHEIITSARYFIREGVAYDNWNGGIHGHDLVLFLPETIIEKISLADQETIANQIKEDLQICAKGIENEFLNETLFELVDQGDAEFAKSVPFSNRVTAAPDQISFWQSGYLRLFISHRDGHKAKAKQLAKSLKEYGISAFVAHDTIEPMTIWQHEITKGLETMEIMLVFLTDDLHDSVWTNQEIGFALGRNIPVITLKLEDRDPSGFIGTEQALRGSLQAPVAQVTEIYQLIANKVGQKKRLQQILVNAFIQSGNFDEAKSRFDRINSVVEQLVDTQFEEIVNGFRDNSQLHNAVYLISNYARLANFLERTTGKKIVINQQEISVSVPPLNDDIPF